MPSHTNPACAGPAVRQDAILTAYEALLERSCAMLEAARTADWSLLVDQETEYVVQVERLSRLDAQQPLEAWRAERKATLLERILEQDLEIRQRLVERRDELAQLIGSSRQQLALSRTYGPQQGAAVTIDAAARFAQRTL